MLASRSYLPAVAAATLVLTCGPAAAEKSAVDGQTAVVLDTTGFWRMHHTLRPPLVQFPDGVRPLEFRQAWVNHETPEPPAHWTSPDFDDSTWLRGPGRMAGLSPLVARLCMRGDFLVTDPSAVRALNLTVTYRGGLIVYLNGEEIARQHIAGTACGAAVLAEGYPAEVFAPDWGWDGKPPRFPLGEPDAVRAARNRALSELAVPAAKLRKGVNVLALEIVRAPYHAIVDEKKNPRARDCPWRLYFNTCEFQGARLTAAPAEGLVANAARQPGFRVWNANLLAGDFDLDFGGQAEPLRPVRLAGVRNGAFSGKVAVGSTEPIRRLKATPSSLRSKSGKAEIPPSVTRIRYGLPWGAERGAYRGLGGDSYYCVTSDHDRYARPPQMLGALSETPLPEFPVAAKEPGRYDLRRPGQPEPAFGATVPIWITVDVPRDAAPGEYVGGVTIAAEGTEPVVVPVELEVLDWTLPDPADFVNWTELVQSPDTLAMEYGADLWSERHWELIARSMRLLGRVGCDILYVPLIAETNLGNAESMVRWISGPGGSYDWDFSVMDRYLDVAAQHMGKPDVVCFVAWDIYLGEGGGYKDNYSHNQAGLKERMKFAGKGPMVTALDPATGKTETIHLPTYQAPNSEELWKKLFDELRRHMRRRGLEDAMMIGLMSDDWPSRPEVDFCDRVTGRLPWVSHSHITLGGSPEPGRHDIIVAGVNRQGDQVVDRTGIRVGCRSAVLQYDFADNDPPMGSRRGWSLPDIILYQPRYESCQPGSRWRHLMELNITGGQRGVARGGADFWPVKDSRGRRATTVTGLYPHSMWRNLNIPWSLLAPGPEGPVATGSFELFREGIQESEARIFIEQALVDGKLRARLGDVFVRQAEQFLAERTFYMLKACTDLKIGRYHTMMSRPLVRQGGMAGHAWFVGSGWQERTRQLYILAGAVARKIGRD